MVATMATSTATIVTTVTVGNLIAAGTLASKALPFLGKSINKSFDERSVRALWEQAIAYNKIKRGLLYDARSKVAGDMIEFVKDRSDLFSQAAFHKLQAVEARLKVNEAASALQADIDAKGQDKRLEHVKYLLEGTLQSLIIAKEAAESAQAGTRIGISVEVSCALNSLEESMHLLKNQRLSTTALRFIGDAYAILGGVEQLEDRLKAEPQSPVIWLANLIALKAWYEIDILRSKHWKAVMENWMVSENIIVLPEHHQKWSYEVARRFVSMAQNNSKISGYLSPFFPSLESEDQWFARLQNARQTSAATRMADSVRILAWTVLIAVYTGVSLVGLDAFEIADTSALWSNVIEGDSECFLELFRESGCSSNIQDPK